MKIIILLIVLFSAANTYTVRAQEHSQELITNGPLTRSSLLDWSNGPKEKLHDIGIGFDASLTNFYQGLVSSDNGNKTWKYSGKGDIYLNFDGHKLGLWKGFSIRLHQEYEYGDDVNTQGDGTSFPVNTAVAFVDGYETSLTFSQIFSENIVFTAGKFNMIDAASRTPLLGGGGVDTFMNTALAAPISGVTPPYLLGGSLSILTDAANYSLFIYDPRNADNSDVIENPFDDGVTFSLSTNIPIELYGLKGFQNLRGVYSTQKSIDARDLPQLGLPPDFREETKRRGPHWYFAYSFQQHLFQDEYNANRGWGLFGEWGLSDGNPNPLKYHIILGLGGNSPIEERSLDRWGVAYFRYHASNSFQNAAKEDLGIGIDNEEGFEVYYNFAMTPWLLISADAQIVNPFYADNDESVFTGLRAQIKF